MKKLTILLAILVVGCAKAVPDVDINTLEAPVVLVAKECHAGCCNLTICTIIVKDGTGKLITLEGTSANAIATSMKLGETIK